MLKVHDKLRLDTGHGQGECTLMSSTHSTIMRH